MSARFQVPVADNEPVLDYAPESSERAAVTDQLKGMMANEVEIPLIIGGKEVRTGDLGKQVIPHNHGHTLATWHKAGAKEVTAAIESAHRAYQDWSQWSFEDRAAIYLKAAELFATTWRQRINASTMLNQSKTIHQAEIDAAAESADFFRFNVEFGQRLLEDQPLSAPGIWNRVEYRPLEGFIFAVTPFNFTSIGANLPAAPALLGNTTVWKPSESSVFSNYQVAMLMREAGFPDGVINFVPGDPQTIADVAINHRDLAGIHFTGSTDVFRKIWKQVGGNIEKYKSYPRLVGETGGKDFLIAHSSADRSSLVTAIVRGGFEFQGQKCSALSRVYVAKSVWRDIKDELISVIESIKMGDVADFQNFMGAVIHQRAFDKIKAYIDEARTSPDADVLVGGETDARVGYFVRPTVIQAHKPSFRSMCEEIFGPVVTIYVYDDKDWNEALTLVDTGSTYALTGAVFAQDRKAVAEAHRALRQAAGNFYINDKPTGAVVGQQPFGGARASGTNDKAGSMQNLLRWVSARTIKETFVPPTDYRYPYMSS